MLGLASTSYAAPERKAGPGGSLLIVEPNHALPIVHVVVALRSGSSWDPHKKEGLANLAAATARRGAAGQTRVQLDARLDALGADLDIVVDPDSTRFDGHVLARNLDAFLSIVADIVLRADFTPAEVTRTRRDVLAQIDEAGTNDEALGERFFERNLYGDHPCAYPAEGTRASVARLRREDLRAFFAQHVVGPNVIVAANGDVSTDDFAAAVGRHFGALPRTAAPGPNPLALREPQAPHGWRIQIVDKPNREQAQIFFGQLAVPATDPDYVPLLVMTTSFGGPGMKATMMDELRTKRSLAYGAYLTLSERSGRGALNGWVQAATGRAVPTLKLALKLFVGLMEKGLDAERLAFTKGFLTGALATEMDDPEQRLDARLTAEIVGLPPGFVDELPERVRAVTSAQLAAVIARRIHAHDLAITIVATAATLRPRLIEAKIQPSAIDVVPYDGF
ncbi:MAG TPA: pitrilysin family protein [Polyangia bacterium]